MPLTVAFSDQSEGFIVEWNWSYGDDTYSGSLNPVHEYSESGIYDVSLTVTDGMETDTLQLRDYITVFSQDEDTSDNEHGNETESGSDLDNEIYDTMSESFDGTKTLVSILSPHSSQNVGDIFSDYLVYSDDSEGFRRIIVYDVITGKETILPPFSGYSFQANPSMYQDIIVWEGISDDYSTYSIFIYNVTSGEFGELVSSTESMPSSPDVYENYVVWQEFLEGQYDIVLFNLLNQEKTILSSARPNSEDTAPEIFDDWVVWTGMDGLNFTSDIFLYSLSSHNLTCLTQDSYDSNQCSPTIGMGYVAWVTYDPVDFTSDIVVYDISVQESRMVTNKSSGISELAPSINGERIVWQSTDPDTFTSDIYLYNITTGMSNLLTPDTPDSDQMMPIINGDRIIWDEIDYSYWTYDVYLFTLGETLPPLEADFEANITQGTLPLTVAFKDRSDGYPTYFSWDFGDGNYSYEKDPVHTFREKGSYNINLIINNQKQRSGRNKLDYICAGSPPAVQFTSNVTEGVAPLTLQFTDQSLHNPDSWNWSFGDGLGSLEKDPVHVFNRSGEFSVSLTAGNKFGNNTHDELGYIHVMDGISGTANFSLPGITIQKQDDFQEILINTSINPGISDPNGTKFSVSPFEESGIEEISFITAPGEYFDFTGGDRIKGNISSIHMRSRELSLENGSKPSIVYDLTTSRYPEAGFIICEVWENATPRDEHLFRNTAISTGNFSDLAHTAYTSVFREENVLNYSYTSLIFGVSSDWVEKYGWRWCHSIESNPPGAAVFVDSHFVGETPICIEEGLSPGNHTVTVKEVGYYEQTFPITIDDKRDSIHVIRIGDDGTGEVLDTTFIGHDSERNLDFFRAESPNGFSTFGLASLSKSGNILQLVNLVISRVTGAGGGGGGGSSAAASLASSRETAAPTPGAPEPAETLSPLPEEPPAPEITSLPVDTAAPAEPAPPATGGEPALSPMGSLIEGTSSLIILRNVSVVFVVIFVTVVFYLRWKRKED